MKFIFDQSKEDLYQFFDEIEEKKYRVNQLWRYLYVDLSSSFDEMLILPLSIRNHLKKTFKFKSLNLATQNTSKDKSTDKYLWKLEDGKLIETVLMRYDEDGHRRKRRTVCISTQVGCAMDCKFCATGQQGFSRHLTVGEIVSQVVSIKRILLQEEFDKKSRNYSINVVYMGMGEPLANYKRTIDSAKRLNDQKGLNIGARNITISTVGLVPKILQLSEESIQLNLAVSIHAPDNKTRSETVPINETYPLENLIDACKTYINKTNRKVFFEYVLLDGQNDTEGHAEELGKLLKPLMCHLNLIPVNPTSNSNYKRSNSERINKFRSIIDKYNIPSTIRMEKGIDINAGCGQLKSEYLENLEFQKL